MNKCFLLHFFLILFGCVSCQPSNNTIQNKTLHPKKSMETNFKKTEEEWKQILTPEQFYILREKGTERPGSGEFNYHKEIGFYTCAGCGTELFSNEQKFDSHCGWPSFDGELGGGNRILKVKDFSHGMIRTEIVCANCGGHLGHIFDDGPTESGLRYCVNSLSLGFKPSKNNNPEKSKDSR